MFIKILNIKELILLSLEQKYLDSKKISQSTQEISFIILQRNEAIALLRFCVFLLLEQMSDNAKQS